MSKLLKSLAALLMIGNSCLSAQAWAAASNGQLAPKLIGCEEGWETTLALLTPKPVGPMVLESLNCLSIPDRGYPVTISPDGTKALSYHRLKGLWVGDVDPSGLGHVFVGRVALGLDATVPFKWLKDSNAVLGIKQTIDSHGFALGSMQPYLFNEDGDEKPLPAISHPNGPLDQLYWIGSSGLAFATFGTRGAYFKPRRDDLTPTIALLDVGSGRILQTSAISSTVGLSGNKGFQEVAAYASRRGSERVLSTWSPDIWLLWDRGKRPRKLPIHNEARGAKVALDPEGTRVLITRKLTATGWVCEFHNPCPPPTAQTGAIAELRNIETGQLIWTVTGTAAVFSNDRTPAISPDGRYALITYPGDRNYIALISMSDGAVLQKVGMPGWGSLSYAFSPDGRHAWLTGGANMAEFEIVGQR